MKIKKSTLILLGVAAALLLFLVFKPEASIKDVVKWKAISKDADKLLIEKGSRSLSFVKKGNDWLLGTNSYLADPEKIKKLVDTLKSARRFELVDTFSLDEKYEIDASNRTTATLHTSSGERSLIIGKAAPTYSHTFVKIPGGTKTYQTEGNFTYDFGQDANYYRAKQFFNFSSEEARSVEFKDASGRTLLITRTADISTNTNFTPKTSWKDASGRVYKDEDVGDIVSTISHINATAFPDEGKFSFESIAKSQILSQIVIKTSSKTYSLTIFREKNGNDNLAITSERKELFQLSEDMTKRLSPSYDKLLK